MPNEMELVNAIISNVRAMRGDAASVVANAIDQGLRDAGLLHGGPCYSAPVQAPVQPSFAVAYNKDRTIYKDRNTAGFSDESLTVTVKTVGDRDKLIINAANKFNRYYHEFWGDRGFHFDRNTLRCQLRLGVLKVSGRTYKTSTPTFLMDLSTRTYIPAMKPNRG